MLRNRSEPTISALQTGFGAFDKGALLCVNLIAHPFLKAAGVGMENSQLPCIGFSQVCGSQGCFFLRLLIRVCSPFRCHEVMQMHNTSTTRIVDHDRTHLHDWLGASSAYDIHGYTSFSNGTRSCSQLDSEKLTSGTTT